MEYLQSEGWKARTQAAGQPDENVSAEYRNRAAGVSHNTDHNTGTLEKTAPGNTGCNPECRFPVFLAPAMLRDARGWTYQAVRSCDLDRICDK